MTPGELVDAISRSAADLKVHGRCPVRVRMHPLDSELLIAEHLPGEARRGRMWRFMGMDVIEDETTRLGEPVAEFDPTLNRHGKPVGS